MKKHILACMAMFLIVGFSFGMYPAHAEEMGQQLQQNDQQKMVQLTDKQKGELSKLYKEMFDKRKEIVVKKVEYGILTKEKGDTIISHIDEHLEMLEQNNFMFHWDKLIQHHNKQD
jgi:hypothetical protein